MDIMTALWKIPERIAIALAGIGVLSGTFLPGVAEAVYKKAPEEYRDVPVTVINSGPTLLFSDSPETVYGTGILYKDVISGEGRVFFHHVNGTKERLKLAIMVRPVDKITYVTWGCRGIGEPNKDFFATARQSQQRYFKEYKTNWEKAHQQEAQKAAAENIKLQKQKYRKPPVRQKPEEEIPDYSFYQTNENLPLTTLLQGEYSEVLTQSRNALKAGIILKPDQLLTGMFDFYARRPVEVTVLMCRPNDDIEKFSLEGEILPMDEHPLRGTYEKADLTYVVKSPIRLKRGESVALAMGSSDASNYLWGVDALTGIKTENYGNYGVVYHVRYETEGKYPVSIGINPWGGNFSGTGAVIAKGKMELKDLPGRTLYFGEGDELDEIRRHNSHKEAGQEEFLWSPPGASNLPIRLFWTSESLSEALGLGEKKTKK